MVQSTISRGRIRAIEETAARALPGVVEVLTHRNAPRVTQTDFDFTLPTPFTEPNLSPLQTDAILHWGQHVAVVVATTLEAATAGAALLRVTYDEEVSAVSIGAETRAH
jgi:xanthine dehydrogenase YagR molybdenum-binding subunit